MVPELWHCLETRACNTCRTAHVGMGGWGWNRAMGGMNLGAYPWTTSARGRDIIIMHH